MKRRSWGDARQWIPQGLTSFLEEVMGQLLGGVLGDPMRSHVGVLAVRCSGKG